MIVGNNLIFGRKGFIETPTIVTPTIVVSYGYLYNERIVDEVNFVPVGWRVPTYFDLNSNTGDWQILRSYLTSQGYGSNFAGVLKSIRTVPTPAPSWLSPNAGAVDIYGFNCLPSGSRTSTGSFLGLTIDGSLLMSGYSSSSSTKVYGAMSFSYNTGTWQSGAHTTISNSGYSVRFVKIDQSTWNPGDTLIDNDGNVYETVKIGNQVWTKSNWKSTKYIDGTTIPLLQENSAWIAATTGAMSYYV
jgi:uncharacterized protein (TIGR02145 family)